MSVDLRANETKPIYLDMGIDLSTANSVWLRVVPPNNRNRDSNGNPSGAMTYSASVAETTKLKHDKLTTTFNVPGGWLVSGSADFGAEHVESTEWARLEVGRACERENQTP